MALASHTESVDTAWRSISTYSTKLVELTANSTHPTLSAPASSMTISVSVEFPAPNNIASDILCLGIRFDVAQRLTSNYFRAVLDIKEAYEEQCNRTNETCAQIAAVSSGTLIPDIQSRLRDSFVSNYMNLQRSWTHDLILKTQQWLLTRNLNTHRSLTLKGSFTELAASRRISLVPSISNDSEASLRPCWVNASAHSLLSLAARNSTSLVFEHQEYAPCSIPAPRVLENSGLVVLPRHEHTEFRPQYSARTADATDYLEYMQRMSLDIPVAPESMAKVVDSSSHIDTAPSHPLAASPNSKNSSYEVNVASSIVSAPSTIPRPTSTTRATVTKGPRRKLAALPKRSIKATSPLSAPTPTPPDPSSDFQFKPSESKLSSTLHSKAMFAADVSCSSGSVFSPFAARAPAPSSFLSLALARDETSAAPISPTSHTTDMSTVSEPPPTAHPLFGRPPMAPLPSRHTLVYSKTSASSDGSSRSSVVLASSPISRMPSVASDESEGSATVFDHPFTLPSSQPSTDSSPLLPAWSPTSPPPSKGRRRKVAPLPSRHLANEPTFPTFNEKYSREPSFTPTSPPSRAPSLEPAFSDASTSPEPDTLPTPPSSPPGFSFSSPVILSPESHISEPLLFSFAKSRSEHDNGEFHFGSPPPTSRPLQKGRLDFGFPSIDQTLQGSSASFSFSFDRPS